MKLKEFLEKLNQETTHDITVYDEEPPDWVTNVSFNEILEELKQAKLKISRLKEKNRQYICGLIEKKIISDNIKTHEEIWIAER